MYRNVHIRGVGTYHPKRKFSNQYYINHFKKYDKDKHAKNLFRKLGRNTRTIAESDEDGISMSVQAAQNALSNSNLKIEDIDMIISATDTPEFLTPSCALIIKNKLKATNVTTVFDVNSDCIGTLEGMDIASRYLKTDKKYKRALVVSSFFISSVARKDDMVTYGAMSDGAAAVILEVVEEKFERGLLGSRMYTDDNYNDKVRYPACGLSNISHKKTQDLERKMFWQPFDFSFIADKWTKNICKLLEEFEYKPSDVEHYFMSQFSKKDLELTFEKLGTSMEKTTFVGEKYGYTGCTSPIMALDDRLKKQKFKNGDVSVFCSVAAGYSIASLLYKW